MEIPLVAGVAGGVGTSTLAAALRAVDCGIYRGGTVVDILVARATMFSLGCAQRAAAATPEPPILAVVGDGVTGLAAARKARLRMTEPHVAGVVLVPFVSTWADIADPHGEASGVLLLEVVPKPLRGFTAAVRAIVDELVPRLARRQELLQRPPGPPVRYRGPGPPAHPAGDPMRATVLEGPSSYPSLTATAR